MFRIKSIALALAVILQLTAVSCFAQFSGSVQGNVLDPSGAAIPNATVTLEDLGTHVQRNALSDSAGVYRFISLSPAHYQVTVAATGFSGAKVDFILQTNENRDVPLSLVLGSVGSTVEVSTQASLLDTSDSRNQYTLDTQALATLPLAGRNPTADIGVTPGVTGALDAQFNLNYAPENFIDASANGRGENGNMYVVDGLDVTSNVRPGVVNLTPNADAVQEVNVQTNTYSVQYGRSSGIQTVMTTKSGTDQFHGFASELFTYQGFGARGEFGPSVASTPNRAPYHTNNLSFGAGGPIWRKHKFFFFASIQPYHQSQSAPGFVLYEDPAFVAFAQQATPNSPELALFTKYGPTGATFTSVSQTAAQAFGTACGTAATDNIPCTTPVIDQGSFNSSVPTTGLQYNVRLDKYFEKDRVYGNFIRNTLTIGAPSIRAGSATNNKYYGFSLQGNETHTFSASTLNEAAFGYNRIEGIDSIEGDHTVPVVNVSGLGTGFGVGFSQGDYIQHSYHWRDVLTHIRGSHSFKAGYDGWHGDDTAIFQGPYGVPVFQFNNLIDLINNKPFSEGNLSYNPVSGDPQAGNYGYSETTYGLFLEDTWKATKKLTLTMGLRYDNFGNPYPSLPGTIAAPFQLGTGSDLSEKVANGFVKQTSNSLSKSLNWNFAPRIGAAWDPTGSGKWAVHGGFGVYRDQITLGNMADIMKGNPPNWVTPTFFNDGSTAAPIFSFGTSNSYPYGFAYPTLGGQPLDDKGGRVGAQINIGSTDYNVHTPHNFTWSGAVDRDLSRGFVASVSYVGSHSNGILLNGGAQGGNQFGGDINTFAGDKIEHTTCTVIPATPTTAESSSCTGIQTRLNTSFGQILYQYNVARANYQAVIASVRGRIGARAFMTASYTRSVSKDDEQNYPVAQNIDQYYGNSPYDYPNRVSIAGNYEVKGLHNGTGFVGVLTGGYALSGTVILQSGSPMLLYTTLPYSVSLINPALPTTADNLQFNANSGDFNADGNNYDFPNVDPKASISHNRASYRNGVFNRGSAAFTTGPFSQPALGQLGNERATDQFRNPGFAGTDLTVRKATHLTENVIFNLRLDAFNVFNRVNLNNVDPNAADGNFGQSTTTHTPRFLQVGGTLSF